MNSGIGIVKYLADSQDTSNIHGPDAAIARGKVVDVVARGCTNTSEPLAHINAARPSAGGHVTHSAFPR
jgi:hypothetical protein